MTWQALVVGDDAREVRGVVDDIAAALAARAPSPLPGLKGDTSTVLVLAECGLPGAAARLEQTLVQMITAPVTVSLFSGLAGNAWAVHTLAEGPEVDAVLEHFDAALANHLAVATWNDRLDVLSGIAGVGTMLASRTDARARSLASRVIDHLEAAAIEIGDGVTWRVEPQFLPQYQRDIFPDGMFDIGVAHGMPGVIGMLAQFAEAGLEPARSTALLKRAVAWLLDAVPDTSPRFGTSWPTDTRYRRIGWCYGDVGIAAVLLLAGRALKADEVTDVATKLLRDVIAPLAKCGAPDASFCHGAAGFAHIYNVAFQRTGDEVMRDQALRWVREVMQMRRPQAGIAGYESLDISSSTRRWREDSTLLSGVAGTALVLAAAIEDREPSWQHLFLM